MKRIKQKHRRRDFSLSKCNGSRTTMACPSKNFKKYEIKRRRRKKRSADYVTRNWEYLFFDEHNFMEKYMNEFHRVHKQGGKFDFW